MKVDMVVMRHSASRHRIFGKHVPAAIVNAGDGINDTTQALLDAFSIQEQLGSLEGNASCCWEDIMHSRGGAEQCYLLNKMGAK